MTNAASQISDEEFKEFLQFYDAEQMVALVHTIAYANFENRIFLALDIGIGQGEPVLAQEYDFDRSARAAVATPARPSWDILKTATPAAAATERPDWDDRAFDELLTSLTNQTKRAPRIPWPEAERMARLPRSAQNSAKRIGWARLTMGFQPQMTGAWFECMGTFQQEAKLEAVFENSVFWVITRSNDCFY